MLRVVVVVKVQHQLRKENKGCLATVLLPSSLPLQLVGGYFMGMSGIPWNPWCELMTMQVFNPTVNKTKKLEAPLKIWFVNMDFKCNNYSHANLKSGYC